MAETIYKNGQEFLKAIGEAIERKERSMKIICQECGKEVDSAEKHTIADCRDYLINRGAQAYTNPDGILYVGGVPLADTTADE